MSGKRNSGRKGRAHDLYETPTWVVLDGLVGFFPVKGLHIAELACGTGKMVRALAMAGAGPITAGDKVTRAKMKLADCAAFVRGDFTATCWPPGAFDALITNPPFGEQGAMAVKFIERGLDYLRRSARVTNKPVFMALLLSVDFDMAASRVHLFEACPEFYGCIRLRRRIEWFKRKRDRKTGKLGSGPSQHHAWFIWKADARAPGALPVTMYAPSTGALL